MTRYESQSGNQAALAAASRLMGALLALRIIYSTIQRPSTYL